MATSAISVVCQDELGHSVLQTFHGGLYPTEESDESDSGSYFSYIHLQHLLLINFGERLICFHILQGILVDTA